MDSKKYFEVFVLFAIISLSLIPTVKATSSDYSLSYPFTFDNATYSSVESNFLLFEWFLFYGYFNSPSNDSFELNWKVMALPDQNWDIYFYLSIINCAGPGALATQLNSGKLQQGDQNNFSTTSLSKDGFIIANNGSSVNPTKSFLSLLSLELYVSAYENDSTFVYLKSSHMLSINVNLSLNGISLGKPSEF